MLKFSENPTSIPIKLKIYNKTFNYMRPMNIG